MSYGFGIFLQTKLFDNKKFCNDLKELQKSSGQISKKYGRTLCNIKWYIVDNKNKNDFLQCVECQKSDLDSLFNQFLYQEMMPESSVFIGKKINKYEYVFSDFGLHFIKQLIDILNKNFKFYKVGFWIYFRDGSKGILPFKIEELKEVVLDKIKPNEIKLIKISNY